MNRSSFFNRKGSFALEGAIILPAVTILIMYFIWTIAALRGEVEFRSVLVKEAGKAGIYGITREYSEIMYESLAKKTVDEDISDLLFISVYEIILSRQFENSYKRHVLNSSGGKSSIKNYTLYIEKPLFGEVFFLTCIYEVFTPFGTRQEKYTIPLRFWDRGDKTGKLQINSSENIWDKHNFERGRVLRRRFGGNLPFGFPVLSGFQNNRALVIKSMDLNTPTWEDPENLYTKMRSDIMSLHNYTGNLKPWGRDGIHIRSEDIKEKYIKFIFPENIDYEKYHDAFYRAEKFAMNHGIRVEHVFYQQSGGCELLGIEIPSFLILGNKL